MSKKHPLAGIHRVGEPGQSFSVYDFTRKELELIGQEWNKSPTKGMEGSEIMINYGTPPRQILKMDARIPTLKVLIDEGGTPMKAVWI